MDHQRIPHVLIFPLPIQSPVNSMLKLAELLCLAGIHVTFLVTKHNHNRLLHFSDVETRMSQYDGRFQFEAIDDGLPEDDPCNVERFSEIIDSLQSVAEPFLRKLMKENGLSSSSSSTSGASNGRPLISCVIAEGLYYYALDITEELEIPLIFFETISPCCLWVYMCLTKLIEEGELPFKGNDLDVQVSSVPGMEGFLRRRDLPDFCRGDYTADGNFRQALKSTEAIPRAVGLILNTFAELEGPILSHIRSKVDNLYAIGPLQIHVRTKVQQEDKEWANLSNSLWEEDRSCFKWLDSQPPKSVIYVSFGSLVNLSNEEFFEFWHGILNSGHRFLWVIRPGSVQGQRPDHDDLLKELNESVNEMGLIVGWVPQEEVLAHPSVGGFLTHSGWNSTLESMISGLPMICWPFFVDQQVTSRFVSEVWKLGIDMKDTCDRFVIRKNIRDLMARNGEYGNESPWKWSEWNRQSVAEIGGSSCLDFNRLVEDIKRLSMK